MLSRSSIGLVGVLFMACAGQQDPLRWNPDEASSAPAPSDGKDVVINADPVAHAMRDDIECTREINKLEARRAENDAWALMRACLRSEKFRDLSMMVKPPWVSKLRALPAKEIVELVGRILAVRGANVPRDLGDIQAAGIEISQLNDVLQTPGTSKGRLVAFLGKISVKESAFRIEELTGDTQARIRHAQLLQKKKKPKSLTERDDEEDEEDGDDGEKAAAPAGPDRFAPTGRIAVGKLHSKFMPRVKDGGEYVFVARFKETGAPEAKGRTPAVLQLFEAFPPGEELFDVAQ